MAKKRLGISSFDINKKFNSRDEAYKYAKRLIEFIRYTCKKSKEKNWQAEAMVCISNTRGNTSIVYYEHNGKKGKPRKKKEYAPNSVNYYNGKMNVGWHIHILLVSIPMYAFRDKVKEYIDKNWGVKEIKEDKKVYKKDTNIKKAEYFIDQAEDILFCNYINKDLIPKGYSLKDLYKAYMKCMTARRYCLKYGNDKRLMIEENYYNIFNFYFNLSEKEDKKKLEKFMKIAQLQKIAENYERIENNKVQENNDIYHKRICNDSIF